MNAQKQTQPVAAMEVTIVVIFICYIIVITFMNTLANMFTNVFTNTFTNTCSTTFPSRISCKDVRTGFRNNVRKVFVNIIDIRVYTYRYIYYI